MRMVLDNSPSASRRPLPLLSQPERINDKNSLIGLGRRSGYGKPRVVRIDFNVESILCNGFGDLQAKEAGQKYFSPPVKDMADLD